MTSPIAFVDILGWSIGAMARPRCSCTCGIFRTELSSTQLETARGHRTLGSFDVLFCCHPTVLFEWFPILESKIKHAELQDSCKLVVTPNQRQCSNGLQPCPEMSRMLCSYMYLSFGFQVQVERSTVAVTDICFFQVCKFDEMPTSSRSLQWGIFMTIWCNMPFAHQASLSQNMGSRWFRSIHGVKSRTKTRNKIRHIL